MKTSICRRAFALLCAGALALAGCSKGDAGAPGQPGEPGVSTGTITGTLQVTGGAPVAGATVAVTTAGLSLGISAVTAADGSFTLVNVPVGTHTITVSGTGVTQTTFSNVNVVGATTTSLGVKTVAYTPIKIESFGAVPNPAGFGKTIPLSATVSGAPAAVTYAWSIVSGPTTGGLSDPAIANPTFTTGTFQQIVDAGKVRLLRISDRKGLIAVTAQQQTDATYTLRLTVTSGGYTQSADVKISPAGWVQGKDNVGVGTMVIANDVSAASYAWALDNSGASGSAAVLQDATTRNPWFIPDVAGTYVLTNGATSITVKADTFTGAFGPSAIDPVSTTAQGCGSCHSGATQTKVDGIWAEYLGSAHGNFNFADPTKPVMSIFAGGIDGIVSDHYGASCLKCHTTGNDPTATNGGFDESGFAFPSVLQSGNFAALTAAQKQLGRISCENCHGPMAQHEAEGTLATAPKAFFNAEACGMCHDSGSHHDRYPLWSQSAHANLGTAQAENRSSCTRCHTAQGFAKWAAAGLNSTGFSITIANDDVEPQTCQACHDPHTTKLRIDGSAPVTLPAGFTVSGGGAGQLCMSCHNTRNGAKGDAISLDTASSPFQAPHVAAQTDVYMGKNAYFVSGIRVSRHAAVSETCVGCHMAKEGADPTLLFQPSSTNHTWRVGEELCANCHGAEVNGEATKVAVEDALVRINAAGSAYVKAKLNAAAAFSAVFVDMATDKSSSVWNAGATPPAYQTVAVQVDTATNPVVSVEMTEGHGQIAAIVTFTNDVTIQIPAAAGGGALTDVTGKAFEFQLGNAFAGATKSDPKLFEVNSTKVGFDAKNVTFVKGMWNYFLVHGDGSRGIHNPSFVFDVLSKTEENLATL